MIELHGRRGKGVREELLTVQTQTRANEGSSFKWRRHTRQAADADSARSRALLSATLVAFKLLIRKAFFLTAAKNIHDMEETRLQRGEARKLIDTHVKRNANTNAARMRWEVMHMTWQERGP